MKLDKAISDMIAELNDAESMYPEWPSDRMLQESILSDQADKVMEATLDNVHNGGTVSDLREALVKNGALILRCLKNL